MTFHKTTRCVSKAYRQAAQGQTCTLRSAVCNGNPETVVLCHLRFFGAAGLGQKPHDFFAIDACSDCHRELDARNWDEACIGWDDILRALHETLDRRFQAGLLVVG